MKDKLNKNFKYLVGASAFSNLADGIAGFAYPWLFSLITRDAQLISLVVFFSTLPHLIFILFAGVIADKYNRKTILLTTRIIQLVFALIYIIVIYLNLDNIPKSVQLIEPNFPSKFMLISVTYLIAFLFGLLEVTRDNAAQSFLPQIVGKELLPKANGRLYSVELVTNNFLGAPLAGLLISLSLITPFIVDLILLSISTLLIFKIKGNFERTQITDSSQNVLPMIREGISWLKSQVLLKRLAIYTGLANFLGAMQFPIMVLFAQEIMGLNSVQYAFLAYGSAIGGLLGSYFAEKINKRIKESKTLILATFLSAIGMFTPFLTSNPFLVGLAFAITSFSAVIWNVQAVSIRQSIIPDKILGRVNSVYRLLALGLTPIGALFGGSLVKYSTFFLERTFALRIPFLIGGTLLFIIFLSTFKMLSQELIDSTKNNL